MRTLAIETSCDDTSLAVVCYKNDTFVVEQLYSYTQLIHKKYGGVVPELAARSHADKIQEMLKDMDIDKGSLDTISVTAFPWLPGALVVWVTTAHMLGALWRKEVVEVNHIMGHVFSILADRSVETLQLPYVCLTVSGWHNDIYLVEEKLSTPETIVDQQQRHKKNHLALWESETVWNYLVTKLAQTCDDASWEAFDKVSRMLWWPYPWGKWVSEYGIAHDVELPKNLPVPVCKKWLFSFSWLKSQVHTLLAKIDSLELAPEEYERYTQRVAYDFQESVAESLVTGLARYVKKYNAKTTWIVWWVSANSRLRSLWKEKLWDILLPEKFAYCTDNAAMIWVVGLLQSLETSL